MLRSLIIASVLVMSPVALAGPSDVIDATAKRVGKTWTISATIRHPDTGWEHYTNKFEVVTVEGVVLGTRTLHHPHVDEQPFTRSLSGVSIPDDVTVIRVRADDNLGDGPGEIREITLER